MFSIDALRVDHFTWPTALSLATASKYAYERQEILADIIIGGWGFCRHVVLNRGDTQGFIAISDDVVLIAFRGTESVGDWLGNLDVLPTQRTYGSVHRGFVNAYLLVEQEVVATVAQIAPNSKLWITGHSLGGALASIAAAELQPKLLARGIYTFGQPRLGTATLTSFFSQHFADKFARFVNDDDIVTRVPPGYQHVGKLVHFDASGNIQAPQTESARETVEPSPLNDKEYRDLQATVQRAKAELRLRTSEGGLEGLVDSEALLDATVEGFMPSLRDHKLDRYIAHIRRQIGAPA